MVVETGILHRHVLFFKHSQSPPLHQVSFRSSNCPLQSQEHPTGCTQSWHSNKSPEIQGEAGRTNSHSTTAQIHRPFCSVCISKVSLTRVLTCHWGPVFVFQVSSGEGVHVPMHFSYMPKEQQMLYRTYNIYFVGMFPTEKIREEVVQKSSLMQPEIISLRPRKNQVIFPSMASFPIVNK